MQDDQGNGQSRQQDLDDLIEEGQGGMMSELLYFLRTSKKWWLTPIILAILLLGLLVVLGSTGAAPFIYTLF